MVVQRVISWLWKLPSRSKIFVVCLTVLVIQPAAAEQDQAIFNCERLAASPLDSERSPGIEGTPASQIRLEAVEACQKATIAAPKDRRASFHLGRALSAAGRHAEAIEAYRLSASAGFALAQNNLGAILSDGAPGVAADPVAGVAWQKQAARAGLPIAMSNLAIAYRDGRGVARNLSTALDWARLAVSMGFKPARPTAAALLESGEGIGGPRLDAAARYWRDMAADGDAGIAEKLGRALLDGRVRPEYPQEATVVLTRAFQQGSMEAGLALAGYLSTQSNDSAASVQAAELARAVYLRSREAGARDPAGLILHQRAAALIILEIEKSGRPTGEAAALLSELKEHFGAAQDMARFDVEATCNTIRTRLPLYVWDWNRAEPSTDAQIQWYRAVRQCVIGDEVEKSFRDLQSIARETKVRFTMLARQAYASQPASTQPKPRDEVLQQADAIQEVWKVRYGNPLSSSEKLGILDVHVILSNRLGIQPLDYQSRIVGPLANWGQAVLDERWRRIFDFAEVPNRKRGEIVDAAEVQVRLDANLGKCQLEVARATSLEPMFAIFQRGSEVFDRDAIRGALQREILTTCADPAQAGDAGRITAGLLLKKLDEKALVQRHGDVLDPNYNPVSVKGLADFQAALVKQVEEIGALAPVRSAVKAGSRTGNAQAGRQYLALVARDGCSRDSRLCALSTMLPALDNLGSFCELAAKALERRPIRNGNLKKGNDLAFAADILTGWLMSGVNHCRWQRPRIGDDYDEWARNGIRTFIGSLDELGAIGRELIPIGMVSSLEDQSLKNMRKIRADFSYLRNQYVQFMQQLRALP